MGIGRWLRPKSDTTIIIVIVGWLVGVVALVRFYDTRVARLEVIILGVLILAWAIWGTHHLLILKQQRWYERNQRRKQ